MQKKTFPDFSLQRPFNTYFLFIVRSRNSCINDPIRSTSSSNAKWPVSRRWSSALGSSEQGYDAQDEGSAAVHSVSLPSGGGHQMMPPPLLIQHSRPSMAQGVDCDRPWTTGDLASLS